MAANNIYIQVDLNSSSAQANINALNSALAQTGPASEKSADQTTKSLQSVNVSVSQTTKAFEELTGALAGLGIARIAQNIIQVGSELNRAQQAMELFIGSAEKAAEVTGEMAAIAARSPFAFKDLEDAARRLAAFGVQAKEIPAWMKAITDQAAAMGGSIENVNNIVTLAGRVMEKNLVGAMDIMRLLPSQGYAIQKALTAALGRQQLGATFADVKQAIKEGALDPLVTLRTLLAAAQDQTRGAGEKMHDFAAIMKDLGDAFDKAKQFLMGSDGFGPALKTLAGEISTILVPLAALMKLIKEMPEWLKVLLVNLGAVIGAVILFGNAWKLFAMVASPAVTVIKGIAVALTESLIPALANPAILLAIAGIGAAIYGLTKLFPDVTARFLSWAADLWQKLKAKTKALVQESGLLPKDVTPEDIQKGGKIAIETPENLQALQDQVKQWSDTASKTMLQALSSPIDAVTVKYTELFDKLRDEIKKKFIDEHPEGDAATQHAQELIDQLTTARQMEMDAKLMEQRKQARDEFYKSETEAAKAAYDAQALYIEAQDEQDLRRKVANIDKVAKLRQESAAVTARLEEEHLEEIFNIQVGYLEQYKDMFALAGIDVSVSEARLASELADKRKAIEQKMFDEQQKYRLEGWKKSNDAIIEDQKRVYEAFQSMFDEIFDAFTQKTKSIGQALGDVFKKLALGEVRNIFSSQLAAAATEMAGYGAPAPGIRRSGGIISELFQRGLPPRPMMRAPEGYVPAAGEASKITYGGETFGQGGADREIANAADTFKVSAIIIADAANKIAEAADAHQGSADRMMESSADISDASDAIQQASEATGVQPALLRAQAQVESSLNPRAVGPMTRHGQALGLFQLMPSVMHDYGVTDPFNPYQSARAGAGLLGSLLKRYGGSVPMALAAYNMGQTAYERTIAAGRSLPPETQQYIDKVQTLMMQGWGMPQAAIAAAQPNPVYDIGAKYSTNVFGMGDIEPVPSAVPSELQQAQMGTGELTPFGMAPVSSAGLLAAAQQQAGGASLPKAILAQALGFGAKPAQQLTMAQKWQQWIGNLKSNFGIGTGVGGSTSLGTILTSKGATSLEAMAGLALLSKGLQKRVAPLTVGGGALLGMSMAPMLGFTPLGGALLGVGAGLFTAGVQRGGWGGMAMDIGGGALSGALLGLRFGGPLGAAIGAGVGAAVGLVTGVVRMFVQTETERIRSQIKQVYGVDISNVQILAQVKQIVDQNYGGSVSVGIRSQEVQNIVRLYALSTGQVGNLPRPMYGATIAQATGGLQLQPVYSGGQLVANPYSGGVTQYQYSTAVANAVGLKAGTSLGVPGASGLITNEWQALALQTIRGNPSAIANANAAAVTAGDSRLTTTAAMQEPLTALS